MSKFNFGNVLGGAVFGSLNAFLQHNASRDGYAKANRYEVVIGLPTGVTQGSEQDAGKSAMSGRVQGQLAGETARRISFRCDSISIPGRNLRTQMNGNIYGHPMRLFKVLHLHQFKQHFTVGLTLQKDTSLKNGKKYHITHKHTTSIITKNMLVQLISIN